MSGFDPKAFASALLADTKGLLLKHAADLGEAVHDARQHVAQLELDVADTLGALAVETDPRKRDELEGSLRAVLPARVSAISSCLISRLSTEAQAILEAVLTIAEKAALVALKSFVPI